MMTTIVAQIILIALSVFLAAHWLNNLQVSRYYRKVATYLQLAQITYPRLLSYGQVKGRYKEREVEWRCCMQHRSSAFFYSFNVEVKMQVNAPLPLNGIDIRIKNDLAVCGNFLMHAGSQPFILNADNIPNILEELYREAKKYEKETSSKYVFECLECGEKIAATLDKCPKCGWTWEK